MMDQEIKGLLEKILTRLDSIEKSGKLEQAATKEDVAYLAAKIGQHDLELDRLNKRIR
ncbi:MULTISPECIES: hypothetical protein [unclassified Paenibacillus]|uniref:hypothetical protein n=1 Tax=unclassified Paenibacillus TaxID=185978 RepID=UPI00034E1670|nr:MULTISPECIES: hypothetical protein [unclassified Paenibacillus]EPD81996.1 hypothetical protein HMPREF1207_03822 [Paenibacillus sp. HGH0039]